MNQLGCKIRGEEGCIPCRVGYSHTESTSNILAPAGRRLPSITDFITRADWKAYNLDRETPKRPATDPK